MSFHVGQKVVCVDDAMRVSWRKSGFFGRFRRYRDLGHNLNRGDVYTVTAITAVRCTTSRVVFRMLHVAGAWHFGAPTIGFPAFQFRPAVETKTDISIFTRMLTPQREDA